MSRKIFVDTLSVVALINERDAYHHKASELADVFEHQPLVITDAVLLEIGNALSRNFKSEAVAVIDHFLNSPEVEIARLTPELFEQSLNLHRSYADKEWGLVDCVSFAVMRQMDITSALTFDQHFIQAGFTALMRG